MVRVEAPSDAETEREGEVMQRERDLERRVAELEEDNRRLRDAIRKADRRLDDLASVPLGPAAAVVVEAHLYLKGAIRQPAPEIAELEAENRRLREALEHFVEALNDWECGDERDTDCIASQPVASIITFGHLRRARAVLSQYGDRSEG